MALTCFKKVSLVLSNEDYTNAGLDREEMKAVISKIDGVSHCKDWPINTNIEVVLTHHGSIYSHSLLETIEHELNLLAYSKNIKING